MARNIKSCMQLVSNFCKNVYTEMFVLYIPSSPLSKTVRHSCGALGSAHTEHIIGNRTTHTCNDLQGFVARIAPRFKIDFAVRFTSTSEI